jgi:hypothetical protein
MKKEHKVLLFVILALCLLASVPFIWGWTNFAFHRYWLFPRAEREAQRLQWVSRQKNLNSSVFFGPTHFRFGSRPSGGSVMIYVSAVLESEEAAEDLKQEVQKLNSSFPLQWRLQVETNKTERK